MPPLRYQWPTVPASTQAQQLQVRILMDKKLLHSSNKHKQHTDRLLSSQTDSSIYQSDGLCYDFCVDNYAYAVIQDKDCWCSDYTPSKSSQVSTSECDLSCAGYPSDVCGGDNLFGYMALNKSPSGTAAGTSTPSPTSSSVSQYHRTNCISAE